VGLLVTTSLRTLIEDVETHLDAAPSLGIIRGDVLSGPATMAQQRGAMGYAVKRTLTRNLEENRNQDVARVEDLLIVELQARVKPKAQRTTRGELYDIEEAVINRVTELAHQRKWNPRYVDTLEELLPGEWFKLFVRFSFKRFQAVGGG